MHINLRPILCCIAAAALSSVGTAAAAPVYWTSWTAAVVGNPGSAAGSIAGLPAPVSVGYAGEVDFRTRVGSGAPPDGYPSWGPSSTFSGGSVDNAPNYGDSIALVVVGETPAVQTITFSTPVVNPVMAIWSLGNPFNGNAKFVFNAAQPFTIESGGPSEEFGGSSITLDGPYTVAGVEGNGTIQFHGTFSSLTWTNPVAESYYAFTVGAQGVPEPATLSLLALGGLGGVLRRRRC